MIRTRFRWAFGLAGALLLGASWPAARGAQNRTPSPDEGYQQFFDARTPSEASTLVERLASSGISFDDSLVRLKQGRRYTKSAPTGVVHKSHRIHDRELFYALNVPDDYDPNRKYPIRFQLHGGVTARQSNEPVGPDTIGLLAGDEPQIYVIPYAWSEAPWWSSIQLENLRTILDEVKRTYNVDENRVAVSGVSDGGTGAYYVAMRDTTPYASFLPLNGFMLVLANEDLGVDGDLAPNNLLNKPLFVVNGGLDELYPTSVVEPFLLHMKKRGVNLDYEPQPYGAHNLQWWPRVRGSFDAFVRDHPRSPFPDRLTLETFPSDDSHRAHWLVIDALGPAPGDPPQLTDVNDFTPGVRKDFGARAIGSRVTQVIPGSNAEAIGLKAADYIVRLNDQTVRLGTELDDLLGTIKPGSPIQFLVARRNLPVELTGTFDPKEVQAPAEPAFLHKEPAGRIDLVRTGNTIQAATKGVTAFTLLLSPDHFDFKEPIKVVANGRVVFEDRVQKSLKTLLTWAARDNDRTMLFGAEIHINLAR